MSPLGDLLMKQLMINTEQFGLLVSCYAFGAGISGILVATFSDKFDRRKFLLFFYIGFTVATFLCGAFHNYTLLLIARSFAGIFGGVISAISFAIVADLFALNQRGRVMGYIQMSFAGSQILGIPVGILLANKWGWNSTFIMIGVLSTVIWFVILFKMKPINTHLKLQIQEKVLSHFWRILSNKNYRLGFVLITITASGSAMLMPFSSAFLINNVGITQEQLPFIFMFTGLATVGIMPLVGRLSDMKDKFKIFLIGALITVPMTLIYTNLVPIPLWAVIAINIVMFAGISSRMIPAMALNTAIPEQKDRGSYMSLCSSLQQMSHGIASLAAGFIIFQQTKTSPIENYNILGFIVCALTVACVFLIFRVNKVVKNRG
jgi:predicted MFS family arabinose efflux permease